MYLLIFTLLGILINAQKIEIWNKTLNASIILHQKISEDSIRLIINKKENKWLEKNVNIITVNYWNNAKIEFASNCCRNDIFIIKRTFLGNNVVGDRLYFKKKKKKYYFDSLKEFEQKAE